MRPAGDLIGKVKGPSPGVISHNGGNINASSASNLISDQGASLISDHAGGVISNNGGNYRLHYSATDLEPFADARVEVSDPSGRVVSRAPVITDAAGAFTFPAADLAAAPTGPLLVKATVERDGRTLTLAAYVLSDSAQPIAIDPATTLVSKKIGVLLATKRIAPQTLKSATLEGSAKALAPYLSEQAMAAAVLLKDGPAAEVFDVIAKQPAIATALDRAGGQTVRQAPEATPAPPATSGSVLGTYPAAPGPQAIAIDGNGQVWITLGEVGRLRHLGPDGSYVGDIALVGSRVLGVAISPLGEVWIGQFGRDGDQVAAYFGSHTAKFVAPVGSGQHDIAFDPAGNGWVANTIANSVTKVSPTGAVLGTYKVGVMPQGIAVDDNGDVFTANALGNDLTRLSNSGTVLGTYKVGAKPQDVAIDRQHNIWVTNFEGHTVTKLAQNGSPIGTFEAGVTPLNVAIDGADNVWVSNFDANTVTKIAPDGALLGTFKVGNNPTGIAFDVQGKAWVTNSKGNTVMKLAP